jgi:hypothetical protein
VLIASSLLLLAVVSTIVAFRGWPGEGLVDGLQGLLVDRDRPSLEIAGPAQVAADAAPAAAAVAATPAAGTPAAAVLGERGAGGTPTAPFGTTTPPVSGPPSTPRTGDGGGVDTSPVIDPGAGPIEDLPTPGGLGDTVGDTTEGLTGDLGGTVGEVNPQLGQGISDTGESVSDLVRDLGVGTDNLLR